MASRPSKSEGTAETHELAWSQLRRLMRCASRASAALVRRSKVAESISNEACSWAE